MTHLVLNVTVCNLAKSYTEENSFWNLDGSLFFMIGKGKMGLSIKFKS